VGFSCSREHPVAFLIFYTFIPICSSAKFYAANYKFAPLRGKKVIGKLSSTAAFHNAQYFIWYQRVFFRQSRFRSLCTNQSHGKKWAICMTSYALILFPIRIHNGFDVVKFLAVASTIVNAFCVQLFRLLKKSVECRNYPVFRNCCYLETTLWKRFRDSCSVCSKLNKHLSHYNSYIHLVTLYAKPGKRILSKNVKPLNPRV